MAKSDFEDQYESSDYSSEAADYYKEKKEQDRNYQLKQEEVQVQQQQLKVAEQEQAFNQYVAIGGFTFCILVTLAVALYVFKKGKRK